MFSSQEMVKYLKNLTETESLLYRLKMIKQEGQKNLQWIEPVKKNVQKPQKKYISRPQEPAPLKRGAILILYIAIVIAIFAVTRLDGGMGFVGYALVGVAAAFLGLVYIRIIRDDRKAREKYQEELQSYQKQAAEAEVAYDEAMRNYRKESVAAQAAYDAAAVSARERFEFVKKQVLQLDSPIIETEELLEELYSLDIIFPKYRNLPAICMFYEYFASGRCTELSGPNGAYNLYETELRQNVIIDKLDAILGSLEDIRQNQYILYTEVSKVAAVLPSISMDIKNMLNASMSIASSSAIAAQRLAAVEKNTQTLMYLELIKHYRSI